MADQDGSPESELIHHLNQFLGPPTSEPLDADLRNVRRFINSSPRASERFELRPAKHGVEPFTVNNHGVILVQVCGNGHVVILIALIALQRPKIDVIEGALHNALRQVRIVASREHDVKIRTALGGENGRPDRGAPGPA